MGHTPIVIEHYMLVVANQSLYRARPVKPVSCALDSQFRKTTTFFVAWLQKAHSRVFMTEAWRSEEQRCPQLSPRSQSTSGSTIQQKCISSPWKNIVPENKINRAEEHWLAFTALAWNGAVQHIEWLPTWEILVFEVGWSSQALIQTVACWGLIWIFEFACHFLLRCMLGDMPLQPSSIRFARLENIL